MNNIFNLILNFFIATIGFMALTRGEIPFSRTRRVSGNLARVVGIMFIVAAVLGFYESTLWISSLLLIAGLVLGWTMGKRTPPDEKKD